MFASTQVATEVIAAALQGTYSETTKKTSQPVFFCYCFETHSDFQKKTTTKKTEDDKNPSRHRERTTAQQQCADFDKYCKSQ